MLLIADRPMTPPFTDANGKVLPSSIASLEQVRLGGIEQSILIRGKSVANPVLLFLHGGPGMPAMYLAHAFQRPLEEHFVVVQWDQRGAGSSYGNDIPVETMNVEQFIADTVELSQMLSERFGQEKLYLVGHSWGSYLGMLVVARHAELFQAYVGIGQVAGETDQALQIQMEFIQQQAQADGNQEALSDMQTDPEGTIETWLFYYGGELYGAKDFSPLLMTGLRSPEYSLFDALNIRPGVSFSGQNMKYNAIGGPLMEAVTKVEVPVYFFTGRHDYTTPFTLIEEYYSRLEAPDKELVWFEESAHFPFFEESEHFAQEMEDVLAETQE
jgi:pimeloyl-ACP methyl ester carboxylesterase